VEKKGVVKKHKPELEALEAARSALEGAEVEIDRLLGEIPLAARAEKTTIPQAIEAAFSKLRTARSRLDEIEKLIARGSK